MFLKVYTNYLGNFRKLRGKNISWYFLHTCLCCFNWTTDGFVMMICINQPLPNSMTLVFLVYIFLIYCYFEWFYFYFVISEVGPLKLGEGLKIPAAISLNVSVPNLSAIIVTSHSGCFSFSMKAVVIPTIPAPRTQIFLVGAILM